jgi:hypothetical protein
MSKQQDEPLVTRENLEKIIDGIPGLEPYRQFLKGRWVGMVMWWHNRSIEARKKYFLLRGIVIAGGVLIPVLSALNMRPGWELYASMALAIVGAIVAGCAAWEGVANYGEIWREKRRAAELLKVEGWQFFQLCGKYEDAGNDTNDTNAQYKKAFPRFAAEVENMIAREVGEYLAVFEPSLTQTREHATEIINKIAKGVNEQIARASKGQQ